MTAEPNRFTTDPFTETISREVFFFLRYPAAALQPLLPGDLQPLLIAPDTALMAVGLQQIERNSFSPYTDISKIYLEFVVQPRLDLGTATPRFAFWTAGMTTDEPAFSPVLREMNRIPLLPTSGLRVSWNEREVRAEDEAGPILRLTTSTPPPVYRRVSVWGQCHTSFEGRRYTQMVLWTGEAFEHAGEAEVGEIHRHPMWGPMHQPGLGARGWHQMLMRADSGGLVTLHRPMETPEL